MDVQSHTAPRVLLKGVTVASIGTNLSTFHNCSLNIMPRLHESDE